MSNYMAQKADDQIQGGLNKKDELLQKIEVLEKKVAWHEVDAKTQIAIINSHKEEIKELKEFKRSLFSVIGVKEMGK